MFGLKNITSLILVAIVAIFVISTIVIFGVYFKEKENFTVEDNISENELDIKKETNKNTKTKENTDNIKLTKKNFKHTDLIENIRTNLKKDLDNMKASVETSIQEIISNLDIDENDNNSTSHDNNEAIITVNENESTSSNIEENSRDNSNEETIEIINNNEDIEENTDSENNSDSEYESEDDEDEDFNKVENFIEKQKNKQNVKKTLSEKKINVSSELCNGITSPFCLHFSEI